MNDLASRALTGSTRLALQIGALVGLDHLARGLTPHLPLALPSNLVGMLLLSLLLSTGLVREAWIGAGAGLFNRHLAFFFVPIAVGLLAYGALLREHGPALMLVIGVSTVGGIATAGWIAAWPSSPAKSMASP